MGSSGDRRASRLRPALVLSIVAAGIAILARPSAAALPTPQRGHPSPEAAIEAALARSLREAGIPYRDVRLIPLVNEGTSARFRVVAGLRPGAQRDWEDNEAEVEVRSAEGSWHEPHIPPYYGWRLAPGERAARARLVRVEALRADVTVDPRERAVSVPVRMSNANTSGYASVYFRATLLDPTGRLLQAPSGEAAWEEGAGPFIVPWGSAEEVHIPLYLDVGLSLGSPPLTVRLIRYEVRLGRDAAWESPDSPANPEPS
jgi:hypothetical protein